MSEVTATAAKASPRRAERDQERRRAGGGGRTRANLLDELNVDAQIFGGALAVHLDGVADLLEVAAGRNHEVNGPTLTIAVRSVAELAGQMCWLLEPGVGGEERVRRYMVWRFHHLEHTRESLFPGVVSPDGLSEDESPAWHSIESDERDYLAETEAAGMRAKATYVSKKRRLIAAHVVDGDARHIVIPSLRALTRTATGADVYPRMCMSAHGNRLGIHFSMTRTGEKTPRGRGEQVQLSGFALSIPEAILASVAAPGNAWFALANWNGLNTRKLRTSQGRAARWANG